MTSSINNNRCKLLVLDLDVKQINMDILRTFFSLYGVIEWIQIFPEFNSAIIYFVNYLIADHLINYRTCLIGQNNVRLRRFRLDQTNWNIDSHTLYVKLNFDCILTEEALRYCFRDYQPHINKLDLLHDNQALISFTNYDYVDQILLMPSNAFIINNVPLVFERMIEKINKKSRWDQGPSPLPTGSVLPVRDPVIHKLISHIEYLAKQLRELPNHSRNEIERLQAEVFILKNENARLKSKQDLSSNKNIEKRLTVLEDVSNRRSTKDYHHIRRERSSSNEKPIKRRRKYKIDDD
ncbi:unnamed protein product [Adineta steineri]|uniref:Uncharacterized protein n=1 Tax=Adineta steineri TaxID=433720 RepID=A0A815G9N9_9BILA|nr:unnamed protein product [Adineta steineri]CAF3685727.1 unnamed protein product [Adineta steineri]